MTMLQTGSSSFSLAGMLERSRGTLEHTIHILQINFERAVKAVLRFAQLTRTTWTLLKDSTVLVVPAASMERRHSGPCGAAVADNRGVVEGAAGRDVRKGRRPRGPARQRLI